MLREQTKAQKVRLMQEFMRESEQMFGVSNCGSNTSEETFMQRLMA